MAISSSSAGNLASPITVIRRNGMADQKAGRLMIHNPYLQPKNMPPETGDTYSQWLKKLDAWSLGWEIQSAIQDWDTFPF